jgi:integrase/recombinase XerD
LMNTPCTNYEVKKAFVFSLYTGLRWIDVKPLKWENLKEKSIMLQQHKTGISLEIPLHEIALRILGERKTGPIFHLPTQDGANKVLAKWCNDAGLNKHITWHCARHSFSVLLQQKGIDLEQHPECLVTLPQNMFSRTINAIFKIVRWRQ